MQSVQVCWCIVVLFQGVACNKYICILVVYRVSLFLKALNSDCIMQVVSAVSLFQHELV